MLIKYFLVSIFFLVSRRFIFFVKVLETNYVLYVQGGTNYENFYCTTINCYFINLRSIIVVPVKTQRLTFLVHFGRKCAAAYSSFFPFFLAASV